MARIRTVKPEIHQDEAVGELTDSAFRLFIGLITQADDLGRLKGDPRLIGAQVWPYQPKKVVEVEGWLEELESAGFINRFDLDGRQAIEVDTKASIRAGVLPIRGVISPELRAEVIRRDRMVCGICFLKVAEGDMHIDHITPVATGGETTLDNLQVTHSACNLAKGARV